jgi:uncharacterized protein YdeI (YjbR/CyaY-like superfamily)
MPSKSTEVDDYIASAAKFAQPILKKVRRLLHRACPSVDETMKWSAPHFDYKGVLAGMAAFKQHVRVGFWKGRLMSDPHKLFGSIGDTDYGALVLTDVSQLPEDEILMAYIREAVDLNERGVKSPKAKKPSKPEAKVPDDLQAALNSNRKALATFEEFSPSHRREYVEWITEAKQQATRERRLAQAIAWMSQGKPRNWKYMK